MNFFKLTYEPLHAEPALHLVSGHDLGAHVVFTGTVRRVSKTKEVVALEFEAYESMAISELEKIADAIKSKWKVEHVLLYHRLGRVEVGGIAVIAIVSSMHRAEAFEACTFLMDQLKSTVPIWKKEFFQDGSEWVTPTP